LELNGCPCSPKLTSKELVERGCSSQLESNDASFLCENLCEKNFQNVLNHDKFRKNIQIKKPCTFKCFLNFEEVRKLRGV